MLFKRFYEKYNAVMKVGSATSEKLQEYLNSSKINSNKIISINMSYYGGAVVITLAHY